MKNVSFLLVFGLLVAAVITLGSFRNEKERSLLDRSNQVKIRENKNYLTVINVITPKPGQKDNIALLLKKGISNGMKDVPGFISASIHKSMDNDLVVVYAQWQDQASLVKAVEKIESGNAPEMMEVFTNATADYHPYEVFAVIK